jgi:hypothetical protein
LDAVNSSGSRAACRRATRVDLGGSVTAHGRSSRIAPNPARLAPSPALNRSPQRGLRSRNARPSAACCHFACRFLTYSAETSMRPLSTKRGNFGLGVPQPADRTLGGLARLAAAHVATEHAPHERNHRPPTLTWTSLPSRLHLHSRASRCRALPVIISLLCPTETAPGHLATPVFNPRQADKPTPPSVVAFMAIAHTLPAAITSTSAI